MQIIIIFYTIFRAAAALKETSIDTSALAKDKIKLMEGLSTPLESEVGLRFVFLFIFDILNDFVNFK